MDKIILPTGLLSILTVEQIEAAEPKERPYRLLGGNGPYLYVPVSGKKVWQFHYKIDGKEEILIVGKYPLVTLQEARDKAWAARKGTSISIDPIEMKKASSNNNSSSVIYKEWYERRRQIWSVSYTTEPAKVFDNDILPIIGGLKIQDIKPMQLPEVIRRFEDRGVIERANKARGRCDEVFRYVVVTGRAKCSPTPDLADAMKGYRRKSFPFLPTDQIPASNRALTTFSGSIVPLIATEVLRYTALRTKELRSMQWENISFESRIIAIDASMVEGREIHVAPMSDQVVKLLATLSSVTEPVSEFVFTGRNDKKKPVCEDTVLLMIKQIGYEGLESGYGFRHEFSTIMNEHKWPAGAIEVQLAHANGGSVHGIYNHAQYLDKHGEMMQRWADWLDRRVE